MEKKSASAVACPECNGEFLLEDLLDGDEFVTCRSCNRKFRTADILRKSTDEKVAEVYSSAYVDVEKDRTKAYREVEEGKQKLEYERLKYEQSKSKKEFNVQLAKKLSKILIPIVIVLVLIVGLVVWINNYKKYEEESIAAGKIKICYDSSDLEGEDYTYVIERLEGLGFTNIRAVASVKESNFWTKENQVFEILIDNKDSFSKDHYFYPNAEIIIRYYEVETLGAETIEMKEISWPKSEIAKLVPVPQSTYGKIEWENAQGFVVYIGNTTAEQYKSYVDTCWESGFNLECSRGEDYFWADNADGHKLTVRYQENNTMFIRIDAKGYGFNK